MNRYGRTLDELRRELAEKLEELDEAQKRVAELEGDIDEIESEIEDEEEAALADLPAHVGITYRERDAAKKDDRGVLLCGEWFNGCPACARTLNPEKEDATCSA